MAQQLAAQPRHDAVGRAVGREVTGTVQHGAGHDGQPDEDDGGRDGAERRVVQERAVDGVGQGDRLHHDHHGTQRRHGQRDAGDPSQTGHAGRKLRVDQARSARTRGVGAHRLNVVSFTSTTRPMSPSVTARRAVCASSQVAAVRTPSGRSATMAVRSGSSPASPP